MVKILPADRIVTVSSLPIIPTKSVKSAYIFGVFFGFLGAHHFYLRRGGFGMIYLLTLGLCGFGWLIDLIRMPTLVEDANLKLLDPKMGMKKSVVDTYVLWFPMGLLGRIISLCFHS